MPQGDPLSPFLFLIVSDVLNALVDRIDVNALFEGFLVGKDKVHLSILQFEDDTLLFCKHDENMLDNLIQAIGFFEWCWDKKLIGINLLCMESTLMNNP